MLDRLAAMRTFVAIVDAGSLTAAAEVLERSQPAVVRSLAALEAHLGVVLLRRTTRRMSLTTEGREFLERCRGILADVDEAERAVGEADRAPRGDLRMTAPVLFGQMHVVPALADFLRRFEAVRVDLLLVDRLVDLVDEGMDLGLRIGTLADSTMVAVAVGEVRRVVCASPALLARIGVPEHPRELAALPCVRLDNRGREAWEFAEDGRPFAVRVDGALGCSQMGGSLAACVAGAGFSRHPSYQTQALLAEGRLVRVLEAFEPPPIPVSLIYAGSRRGSTRMRALLDHLREALRRTLAPT